LNRRRESLRDHDSVAWIIDSELVLA
jgi:hypothetical protein